MPSLRTAIGLSLLALASSVHGAPPDRTPQYASLADQQILNDPFPYYFPQLDAPPEQKFAMPQCCGLTIENASIDQLQTWMSDGKLTSEQLVYCYSQRESQTGEYIK